MSSLLAIGDRSGLQTYLLNQIKAPTADDIITGKVLIIQVLTNLLSVVTGEWALLWRVAAAGRAADMPVCGTVSVAVVGHAKADDGVW
jgi:hypothetical protein